MAFDADAQDMAGAAMKAALTGAVDPVARARTGKHARRTGGLSIVSRRSTNAGAGGAASVADTFAGTARIRHDNKTGKPLIALALLYAHWAPSAGTESNYTTDWLVKSALETVNNDETMRERMPVAGQYPSKLSIRCTALTDKLIAYVPVGGYVMERTAMTTTGGNGSVSRHQLALGGTLNFGQDTGEGAGASNDYVLGINPMPQNTAAAPSATLLLGLTEDGSIARSGYVWSDSTGAGTDDQWNKISRERGWLSRALDSWPGSNGSIAGERGDQAGNVLTACTRRQIASWHTNIFDGYGINDIAQAVAQASTLATIKASILSRAFWAMSKGIEFCKATITPMLASSTDGFFDPANSTLHAQAALRVSVNQWIRDPSANGFVAQATAQVANIAEPGMASFIDACKAVEVNQANVLTQDGGYWKGAEGGTVFFTGAATTGTTTSLTDSAKAWAVNELVGKVLHIVTGPAAGEVHSIQSNTATAITTGIAFSTPVTNASTYRIFDGNTVDGIHQSTGGHTRIAASVKPDIDAIMNVPA